MILTENRVVSGRTVAIHTRGMLYDVDLSTEEGWKVLTDEAFDHRPTDDEILSLLIAGGHVTVAEDINLSSEVNPADVRMERRDNEFTVYYRDQPLAMVVIGGIPDADDGYWSTANPNAGGPLYEALGADEFLIGAWPDDDFIRLHKDKLTGEGA